MNRLILTDLDNTIYNWVDYFAPCFRAMVHVLARETKESEEDLIASFCQVYEHHGSVEYAFSVQELPIFRDKTDGEISELVRISRGAFKRVRDKRLAPYPTVSKTLRWLRSQGDHIVAITNAPVAYAYKRLTKLRILNLFDGIGGKMDYEIPPGKVTQDILGQSKKVFFDPTILTWVFEKDELKPSHKGYLRVIEDLKVPFNQVWVIGDNTQRDLAPAIRLGAKGIWAKYGEVVDQKNLQTILQLTSWRKDKILSEPIDESFIEISDFSELTEILPATQLSLELL
jgi:FMN phosphatase YigB (HAD superfamily)